MGYTRISHCTACVLVFVVLIILNDSSSGAAVKDNAALREYRELEHLIQALEDVLGENQQVQGQQRENFETESIESRGLKDTLFKTASDLKKTYASKSFLPQTPVDFLRYASVGAEVVNSATGGATFGIFDGAATCLNVFCSPLSLLYYSLMGLSTVEDLIVGSNDAVKTANDDVLKSTHSLPWIGTATKTVSKFIDASVEPVMGSLEVKTKAVTKPIGFAYNVTEKITNACIDIKTGMMSVNLLAWIKDLENGNTALRDDLMIISDYFKTECGAILDKLPTMSKIIEGLKIAGVAIADNVDGEDLLNIVSSEQKIANSPYGVSKKREQQVVDKRAVTFTPNILADHDPITKTTKKILSAVNAAKAQMEKFEPVIEFFDVLKSIIDKVMDMELCIFVGPYGQLLALALEIGEELASGMVDAVDKLKSGDVVGAAGELAETVGNVNNMVNQQIVAVANLAGDAAEAAYDGLKSVGNDVADWVDGTGGKIKDGVSNAAEGFASGLGSAANEVKNFFSGWKRRRRAIESQIDPSKDFQSRYYRNVSLDRSSRGLDLSALTDLGDYMVGPFFCITPREILNIARGLIDTILAPFELLVTAALKPVMDTLKDMFKSIFPSLGFLDDITGLSITMLPVEDFNKLINIFKTNDLFAYVAASTPSALGASCMKYIKGFVSVQPTYTAAQVKCACVEKKANCGRKKRSTNDEEEEREFGKRSSSSHPTNCRYSGIQYQGKLSKTKSGKTCMAWSSSSPHSHSTDKKKLPEKSLVAAKNYCRNPDNKKGPWCYTTDQSVTWEYCDLPLCRPACVTSGTTETAGKWSVTGMGRKCQPWGAKLPHNITFTDSQFPEKSTAKAQDFCHNPEEKSFGPYCVTTTYGMTLDVCDLPYCDGISELVSSFREHMNGDCPGNDLPNMPMSNIHLHQCLSSCKSKANCYAVGHNFQNKQCWLKTACNTVNNWGYNSQMNAYIKTDTADYRDYTNQKCGGNDIKSQKVDSLRECRELCDNEPQCVAFERSGENCYIKHTCGPLTGASGVMTFVKDAQDFAKYRDRDCPYHDIRKDTNIWSSGHCQARCKGLWNCGAFMLVHTTGECYLKKRCKATEMVMKPAHDLYVLKYDTDYHRHLNKDCPGNDIKHIFIDTPKQCAEACSKDTDCVAFGLRSTSCWMKHTCDPATLSTSNIDIHLKKDVMYFHKFEKKDCFGNDFSYQESSLDKCASSCIKHSMCKAFHFSPVSSIKGKCWLKAKCDTFINSGGNQYVRKETIGFERYRRNDCYGNDIGMLTKSTPDDCAKECQGNLKCYGFAYVDSSKSCYPKTKCKVTDFQRRDGEIDTYIETDIQGFKLYKNQDCYGNDIDDINVNGIRECASLCFKMDQCVAFGLRITDFQCWIKRRCVVSEFLSVPTMYSYILQDNSRHHVEEVAHKRTTTQSSMYNIGYSWKAVDGNLGSHYFDNGASETQVQTNPWWAVTLDSVLTVRYVTVVNRGDCCSNLLHDFDVLVTTDSPDPYTSTKTKLCKRRSGTVGSGATDTIKCDAPTTGKNLIISIPGSGQRVTLPEVKVYASTPVYKTACEEEELKVECPLGKFAQIVSAVYGRSMSSVKCPASFSTSYSTTCTGSSATLGTVRRACDGNNKCAIRAANSVFGDPCPGNFKYLDVAYYCVDKYQTTCEGSTMTLQCTSGKTIEMISANFGRKNTGAAVCSHTPSTTANTDCYSATSLSVVARACEGKTSCSVYAGTGVFGEPCANIYKYLEVAYNCK